MHFSVITSLVFSLFLAVSVHSLPAGRKHNEHEHAHDTAKLGRQQAYRQGNFMIVNTGLGQAKGVPVGDGSVIRFVVKYASATRFGNPVLASQWITLADPAALPPTCPQHTVDPSGYSEDCLYAIAYVPVSVLNTTNTAPVYVWLHGGSFITGSATESGLDGSKLATQMKGIVIFMQYRIGVLGFLPPLTAGATATGNLGVKDVITGLKFVNNVMGYFGSNNLVTVGGQSSGGHMVRSLLASPSADGLFRAGTLHGDPIGYGFVKKTVYLGLQSSFYGTVSNPKTMAVADLVSAQMTWIQSGQAQSVDPSIGAGEILRPVVDGLTIVYTLTTTYPPVKKPLMITSNKNDAGQSIGLNFPEGLPVEYFPEIVQWSLGETRGNKVIAAPWYNPAPGVQPSIAPAYAQNGDVTRQGLERVGTDQLWRCPSWDFAKRWAKVGGSAYSAIFQTGAEYATNTNIDYCQEAGMVCHEDEKYIIFGTTPSPTPAQTTLTTEVMARMVKFITTPSQGPNPSPYAHWAPASTTNPKTIQFGGTAADMAAAVNGCDPAFWGAAVPFDWQMFGE